MQVIKRGQERGPASGERKARVEGAMLHPGRAMIPRPHLTIGAYKLLPLSAFRCFPRQACRD